MSHNSVFFSKEKIFLIVIYSLPAILLLWFVTTFSVNLPLSDDWTLIDLFDKIYNNTATFKDFFAQHNGDRIFFPRIIFTVIAFISNWNIKLEIYFIFLLSLSNFLILYKIAELNYNKLGKILFHLLNIITSMANFSLNQYENWLWGFQISWFLINTCLILAIFILTVPRRLFVNIRLSLAATCCFVASFSSAHGLLSWLAVLPSVFMIEGNVKDKKIRLLMWIGLFAACVAIYYIGYEKSDNHPSFLFFLKNPLKIFVYFFTIIGFPLSRNIFPPIIAGLTLFFTFLFFNFLCFTNHKSEFTVRSVPWLSLGWFAILFALITTIGRTDFGIEQVTSSKYITVSVLLFISCVQLCGLWILYKYKHINGKTIFFGSALCLGFLLELFLSSSTATIVEAQNTYIQRKTGENCLEIISFIDNSPNNCLSVIYPDLSFIRRESKVLQKIGFRTSPQNIAFVKKPDKVHGYIDLPKITEKPLYHNRSDILKMLGWAIIPESPTKPTMVLFSYGDSRSFFATTLINVDRPDVAKSLNSSLYNTSGWEANLSLASIPSGETIIKAWIYDQKSQQFVQLNRELKVKLVDTIF